MQTNPIAIKTALNLLGHDVGGFRLPLVEATPEEEAAVRDCLERLGLLQPPLPEPRDDGFGASPGSVSSTTRRRNPSVHCATMTDLAHRLDR